MRRAITTLFSTALASLATAQAPAAPEPFAIYYDWPSAVNGAGGDTAKAAAVFAAYRRVVLGDGLEATSHGDHVKTKQIIALAPRTEFYGYIPLGQLRSSRRLTSSQIIARIQAWDRMGVDGVFLDEAGYDYGVTRSLQNSVIDSLHARGLSAWVNPWVPADVFDPRRVPLNSVGGGNPTGLPTRLGARDRCLLESFQITNGRYRDPAAFAAKADSAFGYRARYGTRIEAVTTTTTAAGFSQQQLDYAWFSALLYGLDGFAWGASRCSRPVPRSCRSGRALSCAASAAAGWPAA